MNDIENLLQDYEFTRTLMNSLPSGLLLLDAEGRVRAVNKVIERLFGVKEQGVVGKGPGNSLGCLNSFENLMGCGSTTNCKYCDLRKIASNTLASNEKQRNKTFYQVLIDSQIRDVTLLISAVPFTYENKKRFAILIIEDITGLEFLSELNRDEGFMGILGKDKKMIELFDTIKRVAQTDTPVLIQGETGTGKELIAIAIHKKSPRERQHFVPVNCGAVPEGLLETELFGHVKGAFTGATRDRQGRFELAHSGTIFLDEVGELSPAMQVKLLRVLQDGCFERVGDPQTIKVDIRVLAATNRDLEKAMADGRFREDLYYRLNVFPIFVPPLRNRKEDIKILVEYFVRKYSSKLGTKIDIIPQKTINALQGYFWPGNVRELENVIERALILSKNNTLHINESSSFRKPYDITIIKSDLLGDMERDHILQILSDCKWVIEGKRGAALRLGLRPATLRSRMKKLGIERPQ